MAHFTCAVCNRCLYKRSVIQFHEDQFEHLISDVYTGVVSFDEEKYICKTCSRKIRTKHVPCQAVIKVYVHSSKTPLPFDIFIHLLFKYPLPPTECSYFLNGRIVHTNFIVDLDILWLFDYKFLQEQRTDHVKSTLNYFAILSI